MKISLDQVVPVPVTHDPRLNKRVLIKDADARSNLKMLNHARMGPGESFRAHSHASMEEVFYFLEGQGKFCLGDQYLTVSAGDCVLVSAGTAHSCCNTGTSPLVFLAFGVAL
ncbi:MAG: cupin domain-containing protein [Aphanocapsa lilacina HA4352-LM1]|jgi:mannose-6-phosphate isomerase-like protein (cupin superfamily)|nr:cupin domain-containing protein [Aphanocapsa lilacina HA4352-LM1]